MMSFGYSVLGSAHELYIMETHFGIVSLNDGTQTCIPQQYPFCGPWGENVVEIASIRETMPSPISIELAYLSIIEEKFYYLSIPINPWVMEGVFEKFTKQSSITPYYIMVGMAPYGGIALWLGNSQKQSLLGWLTTEVIEIPMKDFLPQQPDLQLHDYCMDYINNDPVVKQNLETNGLPPRDLFDNYMKQFTYRFLLLFEHWDEDEGKWQPYTEEEQETKPKLDYIEEALYDGTHDKLHDGGLLNYHEAGKPKKLAMKWHIKKSEYMAYFWFDDEAIRSVFDKFYGIHPDIKTDFVIHIDPEKKKYQLALYRYGMNEPKPISEDVYQLIVFKNKFEQYRSENYNQPRGAWVW